MLSRKIPNPVDKQVGMRVRMRRLMMKMSQEKLGESLGLTFQQVQKYEKGTNRIGSSRLAHIAQILQVPVSFFFEGIEHKNGAHAIDKNMAAANELLATPDGIALVNAFVKASPKIRRKVVNLLEAINDGGK